MRPLRNISLAATYASIMGPNAVALPGSGLGMVDSFPTLDANEGFAAANLDVGSSVGSPPDR